MRTPSSDTQQDEAFLDQFFGPPNQVWPARSPTHGIADYLAPLLAALPARDERPLVLPRNDHPSSGTVAATYVICWNPAHAERTRHLLTAAVAHNLVQFPGTTAQLNPDDPIDAAVMDLVGPNRTYILRPPDAQHHHKMWTALKRMIQALAEMPPRSLRLPRPVGRILNDFELALASGQAEESLRLLNELEHTGGLSLENQAFLTIRRLSRLGLDAELLAHPFLPTIVMAEPPTAVRDAVLSAWVRVHLEPEDLQSPTGLLAGASTLIDARPNVALLAEPDLAGESGDTDIALALIAIARPDVQLAARLLPAHSLPDALRAALGDVLTPPEGQTEADFPPELAPPPPAADQVAAADDEPADWMEWVAVVAECAHREPPDAGQWPPAHLVDVPLARAVDDLDDEAVSLMLAPFIDADRFGTPAWRTARALLERMLLAEYFTPAELATAHVLLEIHLRGAPAEADYVAVLEALSGYSHRWVSVSNALPALDIADTITCAARPDPQAAVAFVSTVLGPVHAQTSRLTPDLRTLGKLITTDLGLGWDWEPPAAAGPPQAQPGPAEPPTPVRVLLYSLDEAVLDRVARAAAVMAPHLVISRSSDKDGSPQLREKARNSDVVVLATRCATHAATGFITDNCGKAQIVYPDGAGSASMIRALAEAIT